MLLSTIRWLEPTIILTFVVSCGAANNMADEDSKGSTKGIPTVDAPILRDPNDIGTLNSEFSYHAIYYGKNPNGCDVSGLQSINIPDAGKPIFYHLLRNGSNKRVVTKEIESYWTVIYDPKYVKELPSGGLIQDIIVSCGYEDYSKKAILTFHRLIFSEQDSDKNRLLLIQEMHAPLTGAPSECLDQFDAIYARTKNSASCATVSKFGLAKRG